MPVPKKRHSPCRQAKRRANWKLALPQLSKCSNCSAPTLPHQVCTECGYYRGRPVLKVKEKQASAKSQKEKK